GKLPANDIDLRECFLAVFGDQAYARLGERYARRNGRATSNPLEVTRYETDGPGRYELVESSHTWTEDAKEVVLREAGEGVDLSAFSAITGQIAFNKIADGWNDAEFVGDQLYTNYPTQFSGEKIPWLSNIFANYLGADSSKTYGQNTGTVRSEE